MTRTATTAVDDDIELAMLEAQLWLAADRPGEMVYTMKSFSMFVPPAARFGDTQARCPRCNITHVLRVDIPARFRYLGRGRRCDETSWTGFRCIYCLTAVPVCVHVETHTYRQAYRIEIHTYGRIR